MFLRDGGVNCRTNRRDWTKLEFACVRRENAAQETQQLSTLFRVYQLTRMSSARRFVWSSALKRRGEILAICSSILAAHKSVAPVCLPYISNLSFVVPRARKLRKLFLPMHTTTASCIFGALYGRIDRTKFSVFTGSESAIAILCYRHSTKKFFLSRQRLEIYSLFVVGLACRL